MGKYKMNKYTRKMNKNVIFFGRIYRKRLVTEWTKKAGAGIGRVLGVNTKTDYVLQPQRKIGTTPLNTRV